MSGTAAWCIGCLGVLSAGGCRRCLHAAAACPCHRRSALATDALPPIPYSAWETQVQSIAHASGQSLNAGRVPDDVAEQTASGIGELIHIGKAW